MADTCGDFYIVVTVAAEIAHVGVRTVGHAMLVLIVCLMTSMLHVCTQGSMLSRLFGGASRFSISTEEIKRNRSRWGVFFTAPLSFCHKVLWFFLSHRELGMNEIVISEDVLAARGGHGESVATITVNRADGKVQRFFVWVTAKNNGGIACEVSALRPNLPQDPRKSVIGAWFKGHKRVV
jgi:hypothetical protein